MSLWIVLCGLLIVTLPRNMGAPCVVYWGRSAFPYARRDQGDPAFNRPQINPPRVGPGWCPGPGLFITLMPSLFVSPESRSLQYFWIFLKMVTPLLSVPAICVFISDQQRASFSLSVV